MGQLQHALEEKAQEFIGIVKSGQTPQVAVKIDRDALARFNLDLAEVQAYIETAMGGHVASEFWDGEKRFDVTVRLPSRTREDVGAIRRVMIPARPRGGPFSFWVR